MNKEAEFLNYIFQNSQMGMESIDKLLSILKDHEAVNHLKLQREEYANINKTAKDMLNKAGYEEKDINAMAKISSSISVTINTLMDKSLSHISEMMIQGSTMGVIEAIKKINDYQTADENIMNLAKKLLRTEESNIEHWKKYL